MSSLDIIPALSSPIPPKFRRFAGLHLRISSCGSNVSLTLLPRGSEKLSPLPEWERCDRALSPRILRRVLHRPDEFPLRRNRAPRLRVICCDTGNTLTE